MEQKSLLLEDLVGSAIQEIRTVATESPEDGDVIHLELSNDVSIGLVFDCLYVVSDTDFRDVWVDFDDFLQNKRAPGSVPGEAEEWRKNVRDYLRLADLVGKSIRSIVTAEDDGVAWVYLVLDKDLTLKIPEDKLLADGDYIDVWSDFDKFADRIAVDDRRG